MSKKLAICVSGQPREFPNAAYLLNTHLITPNKKDYEVDVFCHGWFDPTTVGESFVSAQPAQSGRVGKVHPETEPIIWAILDPTKYILEPSTEFTFADDLKQAPSAIQRNLANMFYSMYMADVLRRRSGVDYDMVVRVRYDLWYQNPIILSQYQDDVDAGFICTSKKFQDERMNPNFHGGYTLTDIFAFGNSDVMRKFSDTYLNFAMMNTKIDPPFGENYLGYQTRVLHQIPIKTLELEYDILHRVMDK